MCAAIFDFAAKKRLLQIELTPLIVFIARVSKINFHLISASFLLDFTTRL